MCEEPDNDGMVTVRTMVVMLASLLVAILTAGLRYLAEPSIPEAIIAGGIAFGAAFWWWHRLIRRRKDDWR